MKYSSCDQESAMAAIQATQDLNNYILMLEVHFI